MSRSVRLARQLVTAVPPAVRLTMGLTAAGVATLRVLVLVTSLVPVFAVFLTVLGARQHGSRAGGSPSR